MRTSAIMAAVLTVAMSKSAFGVPLLSTYNLIGTPVNPPLTSILVVPHPRLQVSLNPVPPPPFPNANSHLSLANPTRPVYFYPNNPTFEINDYSFDIEQTLNVGSSSGGAGAGKVSFDSFQITSVSGDMVRGDFHLIDATNQILETFDVDIAGIDPSSFLDITQTPLSCLPCALMTFSFIGVGADPEVTFSVSSGTTQFAFSPVPEPSTIGLFGVGLVGIGLVRRKRRLAPGTGGH